MRQKDEQFKKDYQKFISIKGGMLRNLAKIYLFYSKF